MTQISYRGSYGFTTIKSYNFTASPVTLFASPTGDATSALISEMINYDDFSGIIFDVRLKNNIVANTVVRLTLMDFSAEYPGGMPRGQLDLTLTTALNAPAQQGRAIFTFYAQQFPMQAISFIDVNNITFNSLIDLGGIQCTTGRAFMVNNVAAVRFPSKFRLMLQNRDTGGVNDFSINNIYIRAVR